MANLRLFYAIELGKLEMVRSLLKSGSDASCRDAFGRRPIHVCAIQDEVQITRLLLSKGAKKNQRNKYGCTPLHVACMNGCIGVVRFLVVEGADLEARDKCDNTPCHLASEYGFLNCLKVLMVKKVNLNAENRFGETPLHVAAKQGHYDVVVALLECGADASAIDAVGRTPLHAAVEGLHSQCAAKILDHGCPPEVFDKYGRSPKLLALSKQNSHVGSVRRSVSSKINRSQRPRAHKRDVSLPAISLTSPRAQSSAMSPRSPPQSPRSPRLSPRSAHQSSRPSSPSRTIKNLNAHTYHKDQKAIASILRMLEEAQLDALQGSAAFARQDKVKEEKKLKKRKRRRKKQKERERKEEEIMKQSAISNQKQDQDAEGKLRGSEVGDTRNNEDANSIHSQQKLDSPKSTDVIHSSGLEIQSSPQPEDAESEDTGATDDGSFSTGTDSTSTDADTDYENENDEDIMNTIVDEMVNELKIDEQDSLDEVVNEDGKGSGKDASEQNTKHKTDDIKTEPVEDAEKDRGAELNSTVDSNAVLEQNHSITQKPEAKPSNKECEDEEQISDGKRPIAENDQSFNSSTTRNADDAKNEVDAHENEQPV